MPVEDRLAQLGTFVWSSRKRDERGTGQRGRADCRPDGHGLSVPRGTSVRCGRQVYVVRDILMSGHRVFVDAETTCDGETTRRSFPAATAIESLLVDEEIELFTPNFVFSAN